MLIDMLCIFFLGKYEYMHAQFDAQSLENLQNCSLAVASTYTGSSLLLSWLCAAGLASRLELNRARAKLEPSLFYQLVTETSQLEPSQFGTSQTAARTEPSSSWLVSSLSAVLQRP
jgi:hypothetical protein